MLAYRVDGGALLMWERGEPQPDDLKQAIADGAVLVAHNAEFEMLAFAWLAKRDGWLAPKKYACTAAMAAALSLPRDLETLGLVLGLAIQKDKEGKRLINLFSKAKRGGVGFNEPEDFPADYEKFKDYCRRDVESEEAAEKRMVPLSRDEQDVYRLGLAINARGLRIDRRSAYAAITLAERSKALFDEQMSKATGGVVQRCTDVGKLAAWINHEGVAVASAAKADLIALLDPVVGAPFHVKQAVLIRLASGKTSVAKIESMLKRASSDGRVRGSFVYHAASTGRFQSFGVNFYNLPRPRRIFEEAHLSTQLLFDVIRGGDPRVMQYLYEGDLGSPLHLLADAIRGFVWAAPRHRLIVSDYSGIEGAVVAWLAGEEWKLKAMAEIIADPMLPDMYRRAAATIMGLPVDSIGKKHMLRQSVGKVSELALGFGGGVGAFASMARAYAVDLSGLFDPVWEASDPAIREKAERRWKGAKSRKEPSTLLMTRSEWLACEMIKIGWRLANPAITQSWYDLEEAVRNAVKTPGSVHTAAKVSYRMAGGFLFAMLPSGRCLAYPAPKLRAQVRASRLIDGNWAEAEVMERDLAEKLAAIGVARIESKTWPKVTALGVGPNKKPQRFALYGGLIAENNTQATARDILINGMRKAEAAGYPVIGTVYDEIITEVPSDFGDVDEFSALICQLPQWAAGLPLTAGGYAAKRYRKG
jgi:DNA polymerase